MNDLKMIGVVGALLTVLFGWVWKDLNDLQLNKADKSALLAGTQSRWTGEQQVEYRRAVEIEIRALRERLDKLETP